MNLTCNLIDRDSHDNCIHVGEELASSMSNHFGSAQPAYSQPWPTLTFVHDQRLTTALVMMEKCMYLPLNITLMLSMKVAQPRNRPTLPARFQFFPHHWWFSLRLAMNCLAQPSVLH